MPFGILTAVDNLCGVTIFRAKKTERLGRTIVTDDSDFEEINEAKVNMDHIYDQLDPRAYFRELKKLRYSVPGYAKPIFESLIFHLQENRDDTLRVLDLGCSYGVNAALLKHDLSMPQLYDHWGQPMLTDASPEKVIEYDKRFFSTLDEPDDIEVIGIDQAENALEFAEEVGLLDETIAANLEEEPIPEEAKKGLKSIDLLVSTGCVGYVTEKTFEQLMPVVTSGRPPWLANFVLRMFPFDGIEQTLREWGYVTEKLEARTFIQREFASADEREVVLEHLRVQGLDPTGKEASGHLHAEFYLSRPRLEAREVPIEQLLAA